MGLTCARPFGRDKPGSSQFFEALFCFGYGFGIFGIELATAVASMIHYDLVAIAPNRPYPRAPPGATVPSQQARDN